ncbi:IS1 family transposase, partial [Escherichia coli]|uniref:IS1 family transposase n=1 Tax=Escherichia coli TaxID=562 RepID=UPI0038602C9C
TSRIQPGSDVIVCAEMDEQWGYVGAKSRQRWLFYAYDSLRKTVVAHVFGERTMATLGRLMSLLSPFDVVIWMTDGWQQLIRLPGQQYDEESGLYYNRHRYYDPLQGRYITQDPIGLKGGWNLYGYQLNPISDIDPLGLSMWEDAKSGACTNGLCGTLSAMIGPDKFDSIDSTAYDALNKINSQSICEDKEFAGLICKDNSGRYFSTAPNRGERKGSYPFNSPCPNGTEKVSAYHTHGADSHGEYWDEIFSGKDEKIVKSKDNNIKSFYLGTPSGNFKAIDNHGKEITNRKGLPNVCRVHGNM